MQAGVRLLVLQALIWHGKFTHKDLRAFCKQILHQKASYAKLNGLWQSEQPLHLCEMSGQLSAERSFDIQKMTWLKIWNIYNINDTQHRHSALLYWVSLFWVSQFFIVMLSVFMRSVFMLIVAIFYCHAEFRYAECLCAGCLVMLNVVVLNVMAPCLLPAQKWKLETVIITLRYASFTCPISRSDFALS
jgi:hypothetical protein